MDPDSTAPETDATTAETATTTTETAEPATPVRLPGDHPLVKAYEATRGELKTLQDAKKTELQRANDDLASEKTRSAGLETELFQLRAAVKHKIDLEDIDLLGTGTADEIDARAKRLADRTGAAKKSGNTAPKEGANPRSAPKDEATFVKNLFNSGG